MIRQTALAALVLAAAPAAAQDFAFSPAATEACFASGGTVDECVGASANACMQANDGGFSTVGMGACFDRELQYWDGLLNAAYRDLIGRLRAIDAETAAYGGSAPSQEQALREMQRAWITFRDRRCDYERSLWGGGTGGGPAMLACLMAETARQTLYLEEQFGEE